MHRKGFTLLEILCIIGIVLIILAVVAYIGLRIYALIEYGNVPLKDCPTWVVYVLGEHR